MKRIPAYILTTIKIALPLAIILGALGGGVYAEWSAQRMPAITPITTVPIPASDTSRTNVTPAETPPDTSSSSTTTVTSSPPPATPTAPRGGAQGLTQQSSQPTPQATPTPTVLDRADYVSTNWAGYLSAVSGGSYTSVSGSWTVPHVTGQSGVTSADAAWVGIGGVTSDDLIQVGTENQVDANGQVLTAAFYEMLPAAATVVTSMVVNQGDTVTASVVQVAAGTYTISITDTTNGSSYSTTVNYTSSNSSAEWIEEDPSYTSRQLVPFDTFGSINFKGAHATVNGVTQNLVNMSPRSIALISRGGSSGAMPTSIGTDGASFSVVQQ